MYLSFALEQSTRNENQDEERVQLCLKLQNQVWEMEVSSFVWLFSFNRLPIYMYMVCRQQNRGHSCIITPK